MKVDFAAGLDRTAVEIVYAMTGHSKGMIRTLTRGVRDPKKFKEMTPAAYGYTVNDDGTIDCCLNKCKIKAWIEGVHYMLSFEPANLWTLLEGMVRVGSILKRMDYPTKLNKSDTLKLKSAIAIVALAHAQGDAGGDCGILWDMARDGEI